MRIIHLLQSNIFSGAEAVACQIISLLSEKKTDNCSQNLKNRNMEIDERNQPSDSTGLSFEMIYVSPDGPIRHALQERNIRYYPLKEFSQNEIDRAIKKLKPDVIHAHDFNASVRAAKYRNVRIISHLHHNPSWLSRISLKSVIYLFCTPRYETILCASKAILDEYVFHRRIEKKTICLPNTIDSEKILRMAGEEKIDPIDLLFVGRLAEPKDPLRFLRIVKSVAEKCYGKLNVVLVGDGPLRASCEQFIRQNRLTTIVHMTGFETNPYKYMDASKLVLMPSEHEGFGLVAVEAMFLGKVVLGTPVGGLKEILSGGGEICEGDSDFVERIIFFLTNEDALRKIAVRAKANAAKYTDNSQMITVLRKVYMTKRGMYNG